MNAYRSLTALLALAARLRHACLLAPVCVLTACANMAEPPAASAPPTLGLTDTDRFSGAPLGAAAPLEIDLRWWRRFDDPALADWVERALANSPGIEIARERAIQARALLHVARAHRRPLIGAEASLEARSRRDAGERAFDPGAALTLDWDLDLWGGLRQAERSAAASLLRSEDLVQAARLATAGLTARAYVEWQEARLDQQLLAEELALQAEVLRVVQVRVRAGLSPQIDQDRAQAEAASIEADAADAAVRLTLAANALQVLAGERPQPLDGTDAARLPLLVGQQPVPRPIDLLRLRPDLRAAERSLAVAAADLGVARAALYPRLRLPGVLTLTSSGGLGGGVLNIVSATLAAVLDVTLFDGGERRAGVDAARSRLREAAQVYRQTLLQALQQAEAALAAAAGTARRGEALERAGVAADAALARSRSLYVNGLVGFIDVLTAQRSALDNHRDLLRARADAARQAIAGFETMGLIADDT